jgi:hypothetical protein
MAYSKRAVAKSDKVNSKEYKLKKNKPGDEVFLLFDNDVDYDVDELSMDELPQEIDNKPVTIDWFVNFWVKYKGSENYVNGVPYRLVFPPLAANMKLVIFDGQRAFYFRDEIRDRTHNGKPMKEVTLYIGDPGGGGATGT